MKVRLDRYQIHTLLVSTRLIKLSFGLLASTASPMASSSTPTSRALFCSADIFSSPSSARVASIVNESFTCSMVPTTSSICASITFALELGVSVVEILCTLI